MFIIIGKIVKKKTKFKCLDFEIAEFDCMRLFHAGIGDDYHFTHSKKTKDEILIFNSFARRDSETIKHVGLIFNDIRFLSRVNKEKIVELFNNLLHNIFIVSIYDERDTELTNSKGFDCAYKADYLRS